MGHAPAVQEAVEAEFFRASTRISGENHRLEMRKRRAARTKGRTAASTAGAQGCISGSRPSNQTVISLMYFADTIRAPAQRSTSCRKTDKRITAGLCALTIRQNLAG